LKVSQDEHQHNVECFKVHIWSSMSTFCDQYMRFYTKGFWTSEGSKSINFTLGIITKAITHL
jgi:hypothetical protein